MPNRFGSFDTPGNAFEWCEDEFTAYGQAIREERDADASGEILDDSRRVLRDGGFGYRACFCRSAARADLRAGDLDLTNGFRVVLSL
ncbi:MAG: SUMF1/EgtB/PvdO family nonheme iron enzyme [Planctomycetaceae bacterium]|nr:SUMF1/EgtB/PvdO family nonheme iron enzyme [Planctomycetaceae bacterium]